MIEYTDVKISRILNPTSIDLGEYVINPYRGCEFACLYCYVRSNRVSSKSKRAWGTYVDVRINSVERLEKEIILRKPKSVLLGSTTECFQPIEQDRGISGRILEVLNKNKIYYTILTRSPYITHYLPLLKEGFCKKIYFTFNNMPAVIKAKLEPKSPSFEARERAIAELLENGVKCVPYFSPVLPWVSKPEEIFLKFPKAQILEFEGLNFNLANIGDNIDAICSVYPELKEKYTKLLKDKKIYEDTWESIRRKVVSAAINSKKSYNIYIHRFNGYFENQYG